jgi:hypothetical protein
MSHEDLKALSDAYRSIYSGPEAIEEETSEEEQLDEARRPNPRMALKRASNVRSEVWEASDALEDVASALDNPIDERLLKQYSDTAKKLVNMLIDMENKVRKIT